MTFTKLMDQECINEDFNTELKMEIFKFLKKKGYKNPVHYGKDFKPTETFKLFKFKGHKFKIYVNDKDFNKPIYDFEWI